MTETDRRFDELARGLAKEHTRGDAIRLGAGLAAVFAASVFPRRAWGAGGPSICEGVCDQVPPGRARGDCIARCARLGGNVGSICGTPQNPVFCDTEAGETCCCRVCCRAGQFCCNHSCSICAPIVDGGCTQQYCGQCG